MDENVVLCQACSTPHHEDCFRCNGICTTYACGCTTFVEARAGAIVELPTANIKTPAAVKALVTPENVAITHSYHRELSKHLFAFNKEITVIEHMTALWVNVIFVAIVTAPLFFLLPFLVLFIGYLILKEPCEVTKTAEAELTIDQSYIRYLVKLVMQSDHLYTVCRDDVEGIELIDLEETEGRYKIRITARGKVRALQGWWRRTADSRLLGYPYEYE